ncbi:MAG: hypothetical protein HC786_23865 [Richelia sp. CSU_2_1]|nr:hypothetical protein [Richelia sp. CSU_2_1]
MYNTEKELIFALKQLAIAIAHFTDRIAKLDPIAAAQAVAVAPPDKLEGAISDLRMALEISEAMRSDWGLQKFNDKEVSGRVVALDVKLPAIPPLLIRSRHNLNGIDVELVGWEAHGDLLRLTFRPLSKPQIS